MKNLTMALGTVIVFSGCASVTNDSTHPMKVETRAESGATIGGASCIAANDYGQSSFKSGDTFQVRRSSKDLDITCVQAGQSNAVGRAISRANAGMWGNIIIGGGVGAIIDHNKGTAYTYPTWVQLIFGKTMVFDRSAEKEGQPVPGTEPVGASSPAVPQAPATTPATPPVSTTPVASPSMTASADRPAKAAATRTVEETGKDAVVAERLARELKCGESQLAKLIGRGPSFENYSFQCTNGEVLVVRCEMGNCRALK
jgi:hypothetical protein